MHHKYRYTYVIYNYKIYLPYILLSLPVYDKRIDIILYYYGTRRFSRIEIPEWVFCPKIREPETFFSRRLLFPK